MFLYVSVKFFFNLTPRNTVLILFWYTLCFTTTALLLFTCNILYLSHWTFFFLVHIVFKTSTLLLFTCTSKEFFHAFRVIRTHLKAYKCLFMRLKDIFASAIGML